MRYTLTFNRLLSVVANPPDRATCMYCQVRAKPGESWRAARVPINPDEPGGDSVMVPVCGPVCETLFKAHPRAEVVIDDLIAQAKDGRGERRER